ncbi:MAG: apolipoprotein N-acyltransferase [Planctomyces sp.]
MPDNLSETLPADHDLRPEVLKIIADGGTRGEIRDGSSLAAAVLSLLTALFLWLSQSPCELAPVAWIALVPLVTLIRSKRLPERAYLLIYCSGFLWSIATLQWMRYGHPAMYLALAALSAYTAAYFPAFVYLSRRIVAAGIPITVAVPIVWTALEFLRAHLMTGFSWYYLGHSQYRWLALIQIADITGVYGISFLIALSSAAIAGLIPFPVLQRLGLSVEQGKPTLNSSDSDSGNTVAESASSSIEKQPSKVRRFVPVAATTLLVLLCCAYGSIRLTHETPTFPGPSFALIQGNFTPEVKHSPESWNRLYDIHTTLTERCSDLQPDIVVWPETMFPWPEQSVDGDVSDEDIIARLPSEQFEGMDSEVSEITSSWRRNDVRNLLEHQSQTCGASLCVGLQSHVITKDSLRVFNSAAFVRPDTGYVGRYDKIHRVVFGEYIPLRNVFPWLSSLTPFGSHSGIDAGDSPKLFEYRGFQMAPLICFEDTVPHLVRRMATQRTTEGKRCQVLVNLTNDAWFHGSSELDQHLMTSIFRCIENRTPMVRAVNGGISAFIDGSGRIREPDKILTLRDDTDPRRSELNEIHGMRDPETGRWRRQFNGILFGEIPLDRREAPYSSIGDCFAWMCTIVGLALCFRRQR